MSKDDVLALLETDMTDPGSLKDGEYLEEHVLSHSKLVVQTDRNGLIEALREWMSERSDPRTMLAARVVAELGLVELKPELATLRDEISEGNTFPHLSLGGRRFYFRVVSDYFDELP
jgi:hypothetical protein